MTTTQLEPVWLIVPMQAHITDDAIELGWYPHTRGAARRRPVVR
jgi:hypothetical protein